jgi:16S rRNA (cytosine967-C5)-methyltransferase
MTPRDLITSRIAQRARSFPEMDLGEPDVTGLDARDAALARSIDAAVARHWLALQAVLQHCLSRAWTAVQAEVQGALLVGAAQLLVLDRVPDYAAIHEAVEWTKRRLNPNAAGLVNAVLRKVAALRGETIDPSLRDAASAELLRNDLPLGDGRVRRLVEPVFAADPLRRLAQQTSHPEELLAHWSAAHGHDAVRALALHSLVQAPILITGIGDQPMDAWREALTPHEIPGWFVCRASHEDLMAILASRPHARVQDPASAAPVEATAPITPPPLLVIDACAGRGTKTCQLAAVHPQARIIAADIDPARHAALERSFAGHDRVTVLPHGELRRFAGQCDLLLLDVPCSNTGVLARRIEAKYRYSRAGVARLIDLQRQIVADHLVLLGDRGRVLYSTCSLEPAENEQQAAWLERWHPLRVESSRLTLPAGAPGEDPGRYHDGGYFALLRRANR